MCKEMVEKDVFFSYELWVMSDEWTPRSGYWYLPLIARIAMDSYLLARKLAEIL